MEVGDLEPVKTFLSAKSRTSKNTGKSYLNALRRFNGFLNPDTVETILQQIIKGEKDVYRILDSFVGDLVKRRYPAISIQQYMAAIKSYLGYHDIDIVPRIFKKKVGMPKVFREDEQAIDASDIRKILLKCNRRLRVYVLLLASGGMREIEALAIRNRDIYFGSPTRIHIRKEYAKTHVARGIYISDEATKELRDWIDWKYRPETGKTKKTEDLVFAVAPRRTKDYDPNLMYANIEREFIKTLELAGFTERKENSRVHTITLRSFRRFVQSTISDTAGKDYAEWFLGHKKSPYYTKKETELRDIYSTKCVKYLTFLDYSLLEASGKSIDAELQVKDKQIQSLASRVESQDKEMQALKEQLEEIRYSYQDLMIRNTFAYNLTKDGRWELTPNKAYPDGRWDY